VRTAVRTAVRIAANAAVDSSRMHRGAAMCDGARPAGRELRHSPFAAIAPKDSANVRSGMSTSTDPTRRVVLAGAGAGVGLVVLAACSTGSSSGSGGGAMTSAGGITPGETITGVADVPVGGAVSATAGGTDVLVTQPTAGQVFAFSAICTHNGCTVAPGNRELDCPCHGSRFDLTTGAVLGGPAPAPLPQIAVVVQDGKVITA
jgi:Rieske Fe-S protein